MNPNYRSWLESQGYDFGTITSQLHRVGRVEEHLGNLEEHFKSNDLEAVLENLKYSTEDERRGRPNPTSIPIKGVLRTNLASYRNAVALYRKFLDGDDGQHRSPRRPIDRSQTASTPVRPDAIALASRFPLELRRTASDMAKHYELFYMLENEARSIVERVMYQLHGEGWWKQVPDDIQQTCRKNRQREIDAGVTIRSERQVDYVTFGELSQIIENQWKAFSSLMTSQAAMKSLFRSLNTLRSVIAHCGVLADDEVDRLSLAVRDWFRLVTRDA